MLPWRRADYNGRGERITHLSGDVMREAIHTPIYIPQDGEPRRQRSPCGQAHQLHVGIAEKMELTLFKSSQATIVKGARCPSAALFTTDDQTIAQATGIPIHLGALSLAVEAVTRKFPLNHMQPGEWTVNLALTA